MRRDNGSINQAIEAIKADNLAALKQIKRGRLSAVIKHEIEISQEDETLIFAEGSSLLHVALGLGSLQCVKYLIDSKVKYVQNKAGASEIHMLLLTKK